jgi:hypothetical protein
MLDMTNLCTPSQYYLLFSITGLLIMITFNIITGSKCGTISNLFTFMTQILYILFWSFILNKICQKGYKKFSWFLFLLPIVSSSVFISLMTMSMVLGENAYTILEEEKAKEETNDAERNKNEEPTSDEELPNEEEPTSDSESFLNSNKKTIDWHKNSIEF